MRYSIRGYAKYRGVTEGAVRKAIKSGRIDKSEDGLIDPDIADAQWSANTDFVKSRAPIKSNHSTTSKSQTIDIQSNEKAYQRAKIANEVLKAKIGKIELKILKGELIDRKKTQDAVFNLARQIRDHWINWPARVSAQFAAELKLDEHVVYTVLETEIRNELARRAERHRKNS